MSKLLFDEQPLVIDRKLAKVFGLNEAIVIQQVHYWIKINERKKNNFYDGRYWTYNTLKQWHEDNFDYWSFDTVRRTFSKLEKMGVLIVGNYNPDPRDRTKWYSINYKKIEDIVDEQHEEQCKHNCICAKCTNGTTTAFVQNAYMQNAQMHEGKMHRPLPETSTEITNRLIDCSADALNENSFYENEEASYDEIWEALLKHGCSAMVQDTVNLTQTEYLAEIHTMLVKQFPNLLDPEIVRIACDMFSNRAYDWKNFEMKIQIENPIGFFRSCYQDAIKVYKIRNSKNMGPNNRSIPYP